MSTIDLAADSDFDGEFDSDFDGVDIPASKKRTIHELDLSDAEEEEAEAESEPEEKSFIPPPTLLDIFLNETYSENIRIETEDQRRDEQTFNDFVDTCIQELCEAYKEPSDDVPVDVVNKGKWLKDNYVEILRLWKVFAPFESKLKNKFLETRVASMSPEELGQAGEKYKVPVEALQALGRLHAFKSKSRHDVFNLGRQWRVANFSLFFSFCERRRFHASLTVTMKSGHPQVRSFCCNMCNSENKKKKI